MQKNHAQADVKDASHAVAAVKGCQAPTESLISQTLWAEFLKNRGGYFFDGFCRG